MRLKEGQVFAGYTVVRKLGRGGMASIYLVSEPDFARQVALKVLPEDLADEPSFVARFQQEAQTIATLEHPSIVPLYRFGIEDGVPWMALRYVAGGDLARRMAERPLGLAEGFALLGDIAKALDHAHRRGVIHRDLKPQNILLDEEGHAYLADFGVAKLLEATALVRTGTGSAVGTPTYMSPEQALGHELTGASDIYALGVICYQWWTGVLPFDADTPHAVLLKHAMEPLPTKPLQPLSPAVAAVLTRSLDKNPKARYATATALIEALREAQSSAPGTAPPVARQAPPPIPDAVAEPVAMGFAAREAPTSPPAPPHSGAITPPPASTPRPAVQITRPPARAGAAPAASSSALWWWIGGLGGLLVLIVIGVLVWAVMQTAAAPAVPGDYEGFVAGRAVRVSLHDDGGGVVRADGQADEPVSWSISNADPGHVRVPMGDDSAPLRLPVDALLSGRYLAPTDVEHGLMLVRRSTQGGAPWPQVGQLPAGWREGKVSFACDEGQAGNDGWLRLRDDGQAKVRIGDDVHMAMWVADTAADGSAVVRLSGETLGATLTETRWEAPEAFAAGACASGAVAVGAQTRP